VIKGMVLAGHGIGWLHLGCLTSEVSQGQLQALGGPKMRAGLEVRIYRSTALHSLLIDSLWEEFDANLTNSKD
jgi:LysR family transcriptional regulator, hypochlorite-specific transcription factor HypT